MAVTSMVVHELRQTGGDQDEWGDDDVQIFESDLTGSDFVLGGDDYPPGSVAKTEIADW